MRSRIFAAAALAFGTCVGGCAATKTTSKVAVDYNRIFAQTRDEVLVTNILRASAREPLLFSTMGTVTGGVRNTGSVKLPLPGLFGTGTTVISPEFTVTEGINPSVNIVPLTNKEFTEGLLRPVSPETINYFLNQGWDPELVLMLVVGGVVCENGAVIFNRGQPGVGADGKPTGSRYGDFVDMFKAVERFPIKTVGEPQITVVRMPTKEALSFLKDGVGKGRKIEKVESVFKGKQRTELVDVTISKGADSRLTGLDTTKVCAGLKPAKNRDEQLGNETLMEIEPSASGQKQGKAMLRSLESILYFLGETHRWRWQDTPGCVSRNAQLRWPFYVRSRLRWNAAQKREVPTEQLLQLFTLQRVCGFEPTPHRTFLQTKFNDAHYYILRQDDAGEEDRTLTTLSLLNELIALQVSESSVTSATPLIAISER